MARKSVTNNDILISAREKTSPKVYFLMVKLVGEDRGDLAKLVQKTDYLLEYANTCIKQRDINEARESLENAKTRIEGLKKEGVDTECLDYLYEGMEKQLKK